MRRSRLALPAPLSISLTSASASCPTQIWRISGRTSRHGNKRQESAAWDQLLHKQFDTVIVQLGLDVQILLRKRLGYLWCFQQFQVSVHFWIDHLQLGKKMIYFLKCDFNTCLFLCPSEGIKKKKSRVSVVSKPKGKWRTWTSAL